MPTFPILLKSREASGRQTSHSLAKIFPLFAPPFSILSIGNNNAIAAPPCLPMPYSCGGFHIFCRQTRKTVLVDVELFLNYLALSDLQRKRISKCIQNHCGLMNAIAMPKICKLAMCLRIAARLQFVTRQKPPRSCYLHGSTPRKESFWGISGAGNCLFPQYPFFAAKLECLF